MIPLFKYLKSKYAHNLLFAGIVRIGTLYDFRNEELYGNTIGDLEEGKISSKMHVKHEIWNTENIPEFVTTNNFIKLQDNSNIILRNCTFSSHQQSPDCFLYCTNLYFDEKQMLKGDWDACVLIHNPDKFFTAITNSLISDAKFEGISLCTYTSRELPPNAYNKIPPALIKDPKYSDQNEVRAIWSPIRAPIKPKIIICPEIIQYCSLVKT
jgi:hypothetical protein